MNIDELIVPSPKSKKDNMITVKSTTGGQIQQTVNAAANPEDLDTVIQPNQDDSNTMIDAAYVDTDREIFCNSPILNKQNKRLENNQQNGNFVGFTIN